MWHGLSDRRSVFERTPKTGDVLDGPAPRPARIAAPTAGWIERAIAADGVALALFATQSGHDRALPFLILLVVGFATVGWASRETRRRAAIRAG